MSEFAFDVTISAVLRVQASTLDEAKELVESLQSEDEHDFALPGVKLTEFSVLTELDDRVRLPHCFEIDGVNQDEDRSA